MGGGNAQKTATSRARHLAKLEGEKNSGGGAKGKAERSGEDMVAKMAEAAKKREEVKKKREEKEGKK